MKQVRYALEAEKPAHLLLSGSPASAKTMFLLELRRLPQDLLSRFTKLHFAPYTGQEFIEVSQRVLTTRENASVDNAEYIARALWRLHEQNADVRQCVQIARLSRGDRQRIDKVLVALRKSGA